MASIRREIVIDVGIERAWETLRRVGEPHVLFAPVLVEARLEGDVRMVRFANGLETRERILDVDDERRRVAYAVIESTSLSYHHASMQLETAGPGRCLFVWITDFLPDTAASGIGPLIEQGTAAAKRNLERTIASPRASEASAGSAS
jgi:hypothetical protein